jgi:hypothetical protein
MAVRVSHVFCMTFFGTIEVIHAFCADIFSLFVKAIETAILCYPFFLAWFAAIIEQRWSFRVTGTKDVSVRLSTLLRAILLVNFVKTKSTTHVAQEKKLTIPTHGQNITRRGTIGAMKFPCA